MTAGPSRVTSAAGRQNGTVLRRLLRAAARSPPFITTVTLSSMARPDGWHGVTAVQVMNTAMATNWQVAAAHTKA